MPAPIDPNDIIKKRFGKLVVESYMGFEMHGRNKIHYYDCTCDCTKTHVKVNRQSLLKGDTKSCGCAHKDAGDFVLEDLTGKIFTRWKVIDRAPNRVSKSGKTRSIMWNCECKCGTRKAVAARALKTGMSTSCGCLQKERVSEALTDDLTDRKFVHLTVKYRNGSWYPKNYGNGKVKGGVRAVWHCECDCGGECDVIGEWLKNGDVTSCGCSHSSKYETHVSKYLESKGYVKDETYFREYTYPGLKGLGGGSLRFDFRFVTPSGKEVLIECQGQQHKRSTKWFGGDDYLKRLQIHDQMKKDFVNQKGFILIEVPYKLTTYEMVSEYLDRYEII